MKDWTIKQQIVEDVATGITLQFEVAPNGTKRLRLFGDLPFGNREIIFDQEGNEAGSGTLLTGLCKPTWFAPED